MRVPRVSHPPQPAQTHAQGGATAAANADDPRVATILALLDRHDEIEDTCACSRCQAAIQQALPFTCPTCGYTGAPVAVACGCYDYSCPGGDAGRGFGCLHGELICPVCADGEADCDHWAFIKELRQILAMGGASGTHGASGEEQGPWTAEKRGTK